jgi:hypothetical protein
VQEQLACWESREPEEGRERGEEGVNNNNQRIVIDYSSLVRGCDYDAYTILDIA